MVPKAMSKSFFYSSDEQTTTTTGLTNRHNHRRGLPVSSSYVTPGWKD